MRSHNERMHLAWHIAALTRGKKGLPTLRSMMQKSTRSRRQKPQTWQQQLMIAKMWTAVMGGTVVDKKKAN